MTLIDENYSDGIITRMTAEHKEKIMRTARRLNLPDDVLFLYIGAAYKIKTEKFMNAWTGEAVIIEP